MPLIERSASHTLDDRDRRTENDERIRRIYDIRRPRHNAGNVDGTMDDSRRRVLQR